MVKLKCILHFPMQETLSFPTFFREIHVKKQELTTKYLFELEIQNCSKSRLILTLQEGVQHLAIMGEQDCC